MAELLLELRSEEIPARMQARAAADLAELVGDGLARCRACRPLRSRQSTTPRRLVLHLTGLAAQPDRAADRAPRARASMHRRPLKDGFLESLPASGHVLEERDEKKGRVLFAVHQRSRAAHTRRGSGRADSRRAARASPGPSRCAGGAARRAGCGRCSRSSACSTARSCRSASAPSRAATSPPAIASWRRSRSPSKASPDYRRQAAACRR